MNWTCTSRQNLRQYQTQSSGGIPAVDSFRGSQEWRLIISPSPQLQSTSNGPSAVAVYSSLTFATG
ncbi:hypothetical protein C8Q70DRAFT_1145481 [Cubamyces menziesii]|nr:hypothetical protein C8Q70DRAFT_1145481 [Cubamyces menziesii]